MSVQIPGIPQGATGVALLNHLNDRLRRISLALGPGATGAAGATGPAGASGSAASDADVTVNGVVVSY